MATISAKGRTVVALAFVLALAGCVPTPPSPMPTPTQSATTAPTPTAPAAPALIEGGTAAENQPYFDQLNLAYFTQYGTGESAGIVENLAGGGFRKQDMQVTADRTAIDLAVDSIVVSVRLKGECLIGAFQPSFGYKSTIAPLLGTGDCLIGTTVPIQ
jgi:hypothetical protein